MAKRGTRHPKLAEFLVEARHDVEYITTNFSHARKEHFDREEINYFKESLPYRLTVLKIFGYKKNVSMKRIIVHICLAIKYFIYLVPKVKKKDSIVLPSRPPELIFCASLLSWVKGVSTLVDIRDIWPDGVQTSSKLKNTIFSKYCNLYLYLSLRRIDKYVHTAESFVNWLNRYSPYSQSRFIPLGFDVERWKGMRPLRNNDFNRRIKLTYVGALQFLINLNSLILALGNNNKYSFTIVGDGEYMCELRELVRANKLTNVKFRGYLSPEEVTDELRTCHLGVLPMITSSLPNKLFDYIASYLPILVLGCDDSANFVRKYNVGWSQPFNVIALKKFFDKLSAEDIVEKSNNIRKIRGQFSKDCLYNEYVKLISD